MKDRFDVELRSIMEEESEKVYMSDELRSRILGRSRPDFIFRVRSLLNSYIEIPVPLAIGVVTIAIMVNLIPALNIDVDFNSRRVIEIENSQVVVSHAKDVIGYED